MSVRIKVLSPGLFTTVQDGGRFGYEHQGVPPSGPMDSIAHRIANLLVGNPANAAALEMTALGGSFAVVGGECNVCVSGRAVLLVDSPGEAQRELECWRTHRLAAGSVLSVGYLEHGMRAYLAVSGGFVVPSVLGSASTLTRAHLGGIEGRQLAAGDELPIGAATAAADLRAFPRELIDACYGTGAIGVLLGPQDDYFSAGQIAAFLGAGFKVSAQSDRMGYRLAGPAISHRRGADIVSDAIVAGSIQIPGSGQPIIALQDRQTTGGYAKIATVIAADLPRLGQYQPGQIVRFAALSVDDAIERWRALEARLADFAGQCGRPLFFPDENNINLGVTYRD